MIDKYYIKIENGEKVVYLYINNNYEFGSFNKVERNINSILNQLYNFYKCNKFKIVISGMVVTTLLVNSSQIRNKEPLISNYVYVDKMLNTDVVTDKNDDIIITENNNDNTNEVNENINDNSNYYVEEKHIVEDNKTVDNLITIYRSDGSIIALNFEDYIIGVVASEMPVSFNIEALKAQSVVSRTYALKRLSENKILTDDSKTQNYKDNNQLKNLWGYNFDNYYNKIKEAVNSTKNEFLTYNGKYIDSVYHSTSNGMTEDAYNVWGYHVPYLKSVDSSHDVFASSYKREKDLSYEYINSKLGILLNPYSDIIINRNSSNRISEIIIDGNIISGLDFRNKLDLRSNDYTIQLKQDNVIITTYGYGHGVGMSQYGANGMANSGYGYQDILYHYYTNVTLQK